LGEYLFLLILVSASSAVISYLSYPSELLSSAKRGLSLILLFAIVSPLPALLDGVRSFSFSDLDFGSDIEHYEGEYERTLEEAFCFGISGAVSEEFSLDKDNIEVSASGFDVQNMKAKKVYVRLSGYAAMADSRRIEDYLNSLDIGDCEVSISIEKYNR